MSSFAIVSLPILRETYPRGLGGNRQDRGEEDSFESCVELGRSG